MVEALYPNNVKLTISKHVQTRLANWRFTAIGWIWTAWICHVLFLSQKACNFYVTSSATFKNNPMIQTPKAKHSILQIKIQHSLFKMMFDLMRPPTTKGLTLTTIVDLFKVYNDPRTISDPTMHRPLGFRYCRPLVVEGIRLACYPSVSWLRALNPYFSKRP